MCGILVCGVLCAVCCCVILCTSTSPCVVFIALQSSPFCRQSQNIFLWPNRKSKGRLMGASHLQQQCCCVLRACCFGMRNAYVLAGYCFVLYDKVAVHCRGSVLLLVVVCSW